jgi:hypothetical protein
MAQGYLWSKPVDADGVRQLLASRPAPRHARPDESVPRSPELPFETNAQATPA